MNRKAFTLVELLVVISIIGILVGLLMPAVQSARESGRSAQCMNNLKQLGAGVLSYHSTNRLFPPAITMPLTENPQLTSKFGPNWVISILPNIGENALYNSFYFSISGGTTFTSFNVNPVNANPNSPTTVFVPISDPRNAVPRGTPLSLMLCPTDAGRNQVPYNPGPIRGPSGANDGSNWARGNYAANGSVQQIYGTGNGSQSGDWTNPLWRGVMGCNTSLSLDQVHDGASCTILLGEIRPGLSPWDHRGTWAMSNVGASAMWGHGVTDDQGPDNPNQESDDLQECTDLQNSIGVTQLMTQRMGCCPCPNFQQTARSMHVSGVFVCFCDGSVHFISDFIDHNPGWDINSVSDLHVWERLNVSSDGAAIDPSKW